MKPSPSRTPECVCPKCGAKFQGISIGSHGTKCGVNPADLFWQKVDKTGPGGCWLWTGSIKPRNGYGNAMIRGRNYNAHRWAYAQANGPIPQGMEVMHTCDVPACVNPAHMKLGTHIENMKDCRAKGRNTYGEKNHSAKLNPDKVREIRRDYRDAATGQESNAEELSKRYGVSPGTIYMAATRRSWEHVK